MCTIITMIIIEHKPTYNQTLTHVLFISCHFLMVFMVMGVSSGGLQCLIEIQRQKKMNKNKSTINVSQKKSLKLQSYFYT
jgi:hypothetical protein